jgi:hypothetical protein
MKICHLQTPGHHKIGIQGVHMVNFIDISEGQNLQVSRAGAGPGFEIWVFKIFKVQIFLDNLKFKL